MPFISAPLNCRVDNIKRLTVKTVKVSTRAHVTSTLERRRVVRRSAARPSQRVSSKSLVRVHVYFALPAVAIAKLEITRSLSFSMQKRRCYCCCCFCSFRGESEDARLARDKEQKGKTHKNRLALIQRSLSAEGIKGIKFAFGQYRLKHTPQLLNWVGLGFHLITLGFHGPGAESEGF